MSAKTAALCSALRVDLEKHLDPYQLSCMDAGKPMWPDITVKQAQSYALGQAFLKKFNEAEKPSTVACTAALDKFLSVNQKSGEWILSMQDRRDEELIGGLKSYLYNFFYPGGNPLISTFGEIFAVGGVGPGASISARGHDFYTKLWDSPLSATRGDLLFVWEQAMLLETRWGHAFDRCRQRWSPRIVEGNKLSFVNKNVTTARCISTEPTINMWFQLGVGRILSKRLQSFSGICLSNQQDVNRALALRGSASGDFATIDLESASDSLSLGMMREMLPKSIFQWLTLLRSPIVQLPDNKRVELNMMSTMGNGFTFPLQTLIFNAVVATVYSFLGIRLKGYGPAAGRNFGVFGDDIIVETRAARLVLHVLKLIGCVPNSAKSYVDGPFRESCGGDYFNGYYCRGVYCKKLLSVQDYYVTINGLNHWSAQTGIDLPNLVAALFSRLPNKARKYVPCDEADDSGVRVPIDLARGVKHLKHGVMSYVRDVAKAKYLFVRDDAIVCGEGEVQRNYNPDGLWLSFLFGALRGYRISLRQRTVRYISKRRVTTMWDTLSPQYSDLGLSWRQWSTAVHDNLFIVMNP